MSDVVPPTLLAEVFDKTLINQLETIRTKITWKCEKGHQWDDYIRNRIKGAKCPYCMNKRVLKGYNDLTTIAPHLAEQWHPTKNTTTPSEVVYGSGNKAWWVCENNHTYESSISDRYLRGTGCAICAGKKILTGYNDLLTLYPTVAEGYSPKNPIPVDSISPGSHKKVLWVCPQEHEYTATPIKRTTLGRKCPICANMLIVEGINDLATRHPLIAKEWHPTKNPIKPTQVAPATPKKYWWVCKEEHTWEASVSSRTTQNKGCPTCKNQNVLKGYNDLATTSPEISKKWSTKNETKATEVTIGSNKKAWWVCEKGHETEARISDRTRYGCSKCPTSTSKPEKEITSYLENLGLQVENNTRDIIKGYELDIYVPSMKIAVEYNGLYWHTEEKRGRSYHYDKWKACEEAGIQLIQVWEDDWLRNSTLIKKMLAHKLGVNVTGSVYARKTTIKELPYTLVKDFLNQNHIQGETTGSIYLGAINPTDQKLVAVLIAKYEPGSDKKILSIVRYATSMHVIGGFTKLLKNLIRQNPEVETIITFSDNMVSDGELYSSNGFKAVKILDPDYMYAFKGERKHKFGFRLKRFRNDPELKYKDGLTEKELAKLNNIPRIWDAGKVKWSLDVK